MSFLIMLDKKYDVEEFSARVLEKIPVLVESKLKTLRIIQVKDLTAVEILYIRNQKEVISLKEEADFDAKKEKFDDFIQEGMEGESKPWDKEAFLERMKDK